MSNYFLSSEKRSEWRKRILFKDETLRLVRTDAEETNRSEANQVLWIVEEYYRRRGKEALNE